MQLCTQSKPPVAPCSYQILPLPEVTSLKFLFTYLLPSQPLIFCLGVISKKSSLEHCLTSLDSKSPPLFCFFLCSIHALAIIVDISHILKLSIYVNVFITRLKIWLRKGNSLVTFGFQSKIKLNSQGSTEYVLCIMHGLNKNAGNQT